MGLFEHKSRKLLLVAIVSLVPVALPVQAHRLSRDRSKPWERFRRFAQKLSL